MISITQCSVNRFPGSIAASYAQINLVDPPQCRDRLGQQLTPHQLSPSDPDLGDHSGFRGDNIVGVKVC